jgi:hypothetical protein
VAQPPPAVAGKNTGESAGATLDCN